MIGKAQMAVEKTRALGVNMRETRVESDGNLTIVKGVIRGKSEYSKKICGV
jgi:hypothetical protein